MIPTHSVHSPRHRGPSAHGSEPSGAGSWRKGSSDAGPPARGGHGTAQSAGVERGDARHDADIELCDRLARGERGAAETLLEAHLEPLYAFLHYRAGGDRARVEDLVHDTFVVALEQIADFDGRSSLHAWLCGIARNKLRAERRKRAPIPLADALAGAEGEIDAILCDVAREPLPDEVLERQETRDLVGATLSSLPEDYRRALIEKYVEGLSVSEIAGRARKSDKATESTLTRARTAFARVFELLARKRGGLS